MGHEAKRFANLSIVKGLIFSLTAAAVLTAAGCGSRPLPSGGIGGPAASRSADAVEIQRESKPFISVADIPKAPRGKEEIILATTTSTQDSGLLDALLPMFEEATGYKVKPIAVGTGQALAYGKRGEADTLLVHAPTAELELVGSGEAVNRQLVMHNDFVILGPEADSAKIRGARSALDALRRIAEARSLFISRGDDSGTDKLEKSLWKEMGLDPRGQGWYQETGQGMGNTLNVAAEKQAYTISDRGTYLARKKGLGLTLLSGGDSRLLNIYHIMQVNGQMFPKVNAVGGKALVDFFIGKETQEAIEKFGVDRFGDPLFVPDAGKRVENLGN